MVGDGSSDHYCWQRPKDITTSKRAYKIKEGNPGSEVARETTAALAASLMVFKKSNPHYLSLILCHVKELFEFGDKYKDRYDKSMEVAKGHYPSISGYGDERLWATLWLHRATVSGMNLEYVTENVYSFSGAGWAISQFSWDIKYAGVQVLAAKRYLLERNPESVAAIINLLYQELA